MRIPGFLPQIFTLVRTLQEIQHTTQHTPVTTSTKHFPTYSSVLKRRRLKFEQKNWGKKAKVKHI